MSSSIKITTSDNERVEVPRNYARLFKTIDNMLVDLNLDDGDQDKPIPLMRVSSAVLKKIIIWCEHHEKNPPAPEDKGKEIDLSQWEKQFFTIEPKALVELIVAADFLSIENFLPKALQAGASLILGKNAEEIRNMCKIKNDFGEGEEDIIRKQNALSDVFSGGRMSGDKQPSEDSFPLDLLHIGMQMRMYQYLDGRTANELRKVDRLRRQIVDGNPRIFEKKLLIPSVTIRDWIMTQSDPSNKKVNSELSFMEYCKTCSKHSYKVSVIVSFESRKCMGANSVGSCDSCRRVLSSSRWHRSTVPIIGLTFDEFSKLITKGAKIEKLALNCIVSKDLVECIRHLIDSSLHIVLGNLFESAEVFNSIVQEPRGLTIMELCDMPLNDEFFRNAGRGTLEVGFRCKALTDERLAILVRRSDLTDINLHRVPYVTAEGVRRVVQILLQLSTPKYIEFSILRNQLHDFKNMLSLDAESTEVYTQAYTYSYGGGKVNIDIEDDLSRFHNVHIVSH